MTVRRALGAVAVLTLAASCAVNPPPAVVTTPLYPDYPALVIPAAVKTTPDLVDRQDVAWRRLQTGDLAGARRDYAFILQRQPGFYPAEAGLGYVALAAQNYKDAEAAFGAALQADATYRPALTGRAEAAIAAGDDPTAIEALEAVLAVDPSNASARDRLDVVRFRLIEREIDAARRAREAGHLEEAQATLTRAMTEAPPSPVLYRELALVELARGDEAGAEVHARQAVKADPADAEAWAALGAVLDKAGKTAEAATDYDKAFGLDPRPAWRDRRDSLRGRAAADAEPKAFRDIGSAPTVTRADVAAMIGLRLAPILTRSPRHVTVVASDATRSWASTWILQVTQAGIMDVFANHTFQPEATVRRSTLAEVITRLLGLLAAEQGTDLARWKATTPPFADLAPSNPGYPAAALAIAAGAMTPSGTHFDGTQPVTGADLVAAISRLQQLVR